MRRYQVYAVEAFVERALETRSNGYIWHTTGSGKMLTSFFSLLENRIEKQKEKIEQLKQLKKGFLQKMFI